MVQAGTITDMPDLFASGLAGMEIFKIADTIELTIRSLLVGQRSEESC